MVESEGWKLMINAKKAHYFRQSRSLCKKWMYLGTDLEADDFESSDDCKDCRKRINAEKKRADKNGNARND